MIGNYSKYLTQHLFQTGAISYLVLCSSWADKNVDDVDGRSCSWTLVDAKIQHCGDTCHGKW